MPQRVLNDLSYCYCGLLKASPDDIKHTFCGDKVMKLIEQSVKAGNIAPVLL